MKGIYQQMRESKVISVDGKFTLEDLDSLREYFISAQKEDAIYRKNRLKEMNDNRKALIKRSKELGKEIPLEVAWHCYLSFSKTYVGSEFIEKYKEWLD